jgi:hypothetical protein
MGRITFSSTLHDANIKLYRLLRSDSATRAYDVEQKGTKVQAFFLVNAKPAELVENLNLCWNPKLQKSECIKCEYFAKDYIYEC